MNTEYELVLEFTPDPDGHLARGCTYYSKTPLTMKGIKEYVLEKEQDRGRKVAHIDYRTTTTESRYLQRDELIALF
jgi:hypothetical protein